MTNRLLRLLRTIVPVLALAIAWLSFAAQPAAAQTSLANPLIEESELQEYGISCEQGVCIIDVSLDRLQLTSLGKLGASFAIEVLQENLNILPEGAGIEIDDDLTLRLPVGDLPLADADIVLSMDSAGRIERLRGTAEVPFPALAIFDDLDVDAPLRADLGLESGKHLAHLQAPLDDDRRYLFLDFHAGLDEATRTPLADGTPAARSLAGSAQGELPGLIGGQDATLIIDTQEPYAYVAGNISFSMSDQLAFVGQLFDSEGVEALMPDGLPIRERVSLQMATSIGKGAEPFLRAGGAYSIDAGMIGRLIGIELMPLATQGMVTLERTGILLGGVAESRIAPNLFFNGGTSAEIYLPLDTDLSAAYAQVAAEADIPFAATSMEAMARLDGRDGMVAQASMTTPLSRENEVVVSVEPVDDSGRIAIMRSLADGAGNTATRSFLFIRSNTSSGLEALSESANSGLEWSGRAWCGVSGRCQQPADVVALGN